jgi:hypothetical protein
MEIDITTTSSKHLRPPGSSVSSTEAGRKKHDARNTPEQGNSKDNTVSPDNAIGPIDLLPQIENKAGSHNATSISYKDTLTNHATNKEESDWDDKSEDSPVNNQTRSPTETLTPLSRPQRLSTNILTSPKGQNKEDADGKFGKFPNTPEWKVLSDRHKKQNKPFTHYEGIIEQGTVDDDTIQDGITLDFGPAAKKHFKKSWDSPDIDRSKLAEFSKTLVAASEPIYQDARDILTRLAQTTPEVSMANSQLNLWLPLGLSTTATATQT